MKRKESGVIFGGLDLERNFLAARKDFVVRVRDIAKKRNQTIYALVNEALEQLLRAEEMEVSLPEIVDGYYFFHLAQESGFTLTNESLLFHVLEKVFEEDSKSLTDMFYKTGEWLGKYCKVRFSGENQLLTIEKMVKNLFREITDFDITKNSDEILVQCIGSRIPNSYTTLLSTFIEGIMHTFEYSTIKRDVSKGIISLKFR
jgi:hypothetical protein